MQIAIVTDSTAYISEEVRRTHNIHMLPLQVQLGVDSYLEEVDLTAAEFYEKMKQTSDFPTSSQPSIGEAYELFQKLAAENDAVISIHLSSGISGTFQSIASLADEFPSCKILTFDSESSCYVQARYVLEAARLAEKEMDPEQIIQRLEELKSRSYAYFMVDDLKNLQRGGRLSGGAAMIGSLVKIKPILHFKEKKIVVFEKIRTRKKAMARISTLLGEDVTKVDYPLIATVIHANAEEEGAAWLASLQAQHPTVRFEMSYFGPVIGTHLGERAIGLTWTEDVERSQP